MRFVPVNVKIHTLKWNLKEIQTYFALTPKFALIYPLQFTKPGILCEIETEDHISKCSIWNYVELQTEKPIDATWHDLQTFT